MSTRQLARRLGVTQQTVAALERREVRGTATLAALRRAASALHCDLVYAVVPRQDLSVLLENQAKQRALAQVERIAHTMSLEAQGVEAGETERLIEDTVANLLANPRKLWEVQGGDEVRQRRDTP